MAQFFKPKNKPKRVQKQFACPIHDLDLRGQGVGRFKERIVFVPGALPGETVLVRAAIPIKGPIQAELQEVRQSSELRTAPKCKHYAVCGGCQLQHVQPKQQIQLKQKALANLLSRKALKIGDWAEPIHSPSFWGYRTKIRLALDARKQVKLGFRHGDSNKILNISECPVMAEPLQALLPSLRQLVEQLEGSQYIGHVELLLQGERPGLWLHTPKALNSADQLRVENWLQQADVAWLDSATLLSYVLPQFDLKLSYMRSDFIQSNLAVNVKMVAQAIDWLNLKSTDKVLDLFCGMGNFSLPLARQCAQVTGVEGVEAMVARAQANAQSNQITNAEFIHADLSQRLDLQPWWQPVDAILLDPARAGAEQVVTELGRTQAPKVLYVSCNPTTLVRDAEILLKQGYQIDKAGVMDMFPHTHHVESMMLFSKIRHSR